MPASNNITFILIGMIVTVAVVVLAVIGAFFNLWFQAFLSGAPVSFGALIGMKFRKVDPRVIVLNRIMAVKSGIDLTAQQLETHALAGGHVPLVVRALIVARRAQLDFDFSEACSMDLAGQDVYEAVVSAVRNAGLDHPQTSLIDERNV